MCQIRNQVKPFLIRIPDPDPGGKKAPERGLKSATQTFVMKIR
jgi:hypothetical protein